MIDRRSFIILTGAAALLVKLPNASFAADPQAGVARIATYVPRRIFFPTRSSGAPVSLTALELTDQDNNVLGSFSNGQTIRFESKSASLNIVQTAKARRVTRQSILPKSLAAWVIDAVWQSLRNRRNRTTYPQLRRNFEGFQRQSVLETVTPISLYNLIRDSLLRDQIKSVRWNRDTLRFEIE